MATPRLYEKLPVFAQNLALSLYGLQLQLERYGGDSRAYAEELLSHESWSAARVRELQVELLRQRAVLALERVPAYRGLAGRLPQVKVAAGAEEILSIFPVLEKERVRLEPESFIPSGMRERLILGSTGGTTGKPLKLYRTKGGLRRNFAFFRRIRRWRGLSHWSRTATFMGRQIVPASQSRPPFWRYSRTTRNLLFSSFHMSIRNLASYVEALQAFHPEEVVCYPSSGAMVAQAVIDAGAAPIEGVRCIFTTAETVIPSHRALMERAFGCEVADQYGSGEWTVTISQCERGTYHEHPEYGYLEVLDDSGRPVRAGTGRAVATGFINDAMVLMRYDTGDYIKRDGPDCSCGRAFPAIGSVEGRTEEFVLTPDGRALGRLNNFVFAEVQGVVEGQLIQTALDHLEVRVVTGPGWDEGTPRAIIESVRSRVGEGMRVEVRIVPDIPRTPSGKFRAVIGLGHIMEEVGR